MRFHHSTRRGRNRFGQAGAGGGGGNHHFAGASGSCGTGGKFGGHPSALSSRWAQLSYCRQTNLHFNRRLPVELPDEMRHDQLVRVLSDRTGGSSKQNEQLDLLDFSAATATTTAANTCYDAPVVTQQNHHEIENIEQLDRLKIGTTTKNDATITKDHQQRRKHISKRPNLDMHKPNVGPWRSLRGSHKPEMAQPHPQVATTTTCPQEETKQMASCDNDQDQDRSGQPTSKLDLEGARAKLIAQVDKHPFWSNKAAKRMRLLELSERQVYIYELTSFCERRDLEWRYKPYRGGKLGASSTTNVVTATTTAAGSPATPATPTIVSTLAAGKRPVLSSVSELAVGGRRSSRNPIASGGGRDVRRASASQPASPPTLATPPGDSNPQHLMSLAARTANANANASAQNRPNRFDFETTIPRQSMSRSYSSAATSPVKGAPLLAGSHTAAQSPAKSDSLTFAPPLTPPGLLGAPRPVPSAEFVWSIEPPEHLRPQPFASYVHTSEVPGTSFLKKCHGCEGRGRLKCSSCYGVGYEVCLSCTGKGSLRTYSSASAGGALGSSGRSLGPRSEGYLSAAGGRGDSSGGGGGGGFGSSMWDNAAGDSAGGGSRLGGGRYDEPGGITSSGGGGGGLSSASEVCASCSGMGQKRCWICAGRSYITCTACAGTGTLRCHLNLNITYLNHRDELCLNNSDGIIPRERLKLTTGSLLADEIADRLEPIASSGKRPRDGATSRSLPNGRNKLEQMAKPTELSQLSAMSARLLEKHAQSYLGSERLIKQRHKVTQIECFKIDWEFRKKRGHFVVYGDERKVYIAKYPFKSICNIT